jgi:hypothetical protein
LISGEVLDGTERFSARWPPDGRHWDLCHGIGTVLGGPVCEYRARDMQGVRLFVLESMSRGQGTDGIEE